MQILCVVRCVSLSSETSQAAQPPQDGGSGCRIMRYSWSSAGTRCDCLTRHGDFGRHPVLRRRDFHVIGGGVQKRVGGQKNIHTACIARKLGISTRHTHFCWENRMIKVEHTHFSFSLGREGAQDSEAEHRRCVGRIQRPPVVSMTATRGSEWNTPRFSQGGTQETLHVLASKY